MRSGMVIGIVYVPFVCGYGDIIPTNPIGNNQSHYKIAVIWKPVLLLDYLLGFFKSIQSKIPAIDYGLVGLSYATSFTGKIPFGYAFETEWMRVSR
jgi:hypothetical protein